MMRRLFLVRAVLMAAATVAVGGLGCGGKAGAPEPLRPFRRDMRQLVQAVSQYGRSLHPGFVVVPQNAQELLTEDGAASGAPVRDYLAAIDGLGREELFYGYAGDDRATALAVRGEMIPLLDLARRQGLSVLVVDYCSTPGRMADAAAQCAAKGYLSFAASRRELDAVPVYPPLPAATLGHDVRVLGDAASFLCLLNPGAYADRTAYLHALRQTDYDVLIIDLFVDGADALTADEVGSLRNKASGGHRLLLAYLSIGEAENYRYYWRPQWSGLPPAWLAGANPDWPGNYKVRYWDPDWQAILLGGDGSYVQRVVAAGFDGVYLDLVDAYQFFEP